MIEVPEHQRAALAQVLADAHGRVIIDTVEATTGTWIQVDVPEDEYTMVIDQYGKATSPT